MIRTVTIGTSNAISRVKSVLKNNYHINVIYGEDFFSKNLLSIKDLYEIQNADVAFLFGTWGSTFDKRQWHPQNNLRRQAWLENINTFFTNVLDSYDKKYIVFETGSLCRIRSAITGTTHWKDETPYYYRMGLNHWTYGRGKFCKPKEDRLEKFITENPKVKKHLSNQFYNHQWKNNNDGFIVICPGLENDPTSTKPAEQFVQDSYNEIRKYTDRPIKVKPHPKSSIDYSNYEKIPDTTTFKNLSGKMYCAVLDNSTSIFELTFLGIPCFTSSANFGYKLGNSDLSKINDINYNTPEQMKEWYNEMAHTEFTLDEIGNDKILKKIEELIYG